MTIFFIVLKKSASCNYSKTTGCIAIKCNVKYIRIKLDLFCKYETFKLSVSIFGNNSRFDILLGKR